MYYVLCERVCSTARSALCELHCSTVHSVMSVFTILRLALQGIICLTVMADSASSSMRSDVVAIVAKSMHLQGGLWVGFLRAVLYLTLSVRIMLLAFIHRLRLIHPRPISSIYLVPSFLVINQSNSLIWDFWSAVKFINFRFLTVEFINFRFFDSEIH